MVALFPARPPWADRWGGGDFAAARGRRGGVAPATVLEPEAAALLAAKILALGHEELRKRVFAYQAALRAAIEADDRDLR